MKKTPWFPGNVKPERVGVYERKRHKDCLKFSRWTGNHWGLSGDTPNEAAEDYGDRSSAQNIGWRGLTTKDGK